MKTKQFNCRKKVELDTCVAGGRGGGVHREFAASMSTRVSQQILPAAVLSPPRPTIEVFIFPFSSPEKSRLRSCAITTDLYRRLGVGAALISFLIRALSVATTPLALTRLYLALFVWVLFLTRRRRGGKRRRRRRRSHLSIFLTGCTSQQTWILSPPAPRAACTSDS